MIDTDVAPYFNDANNAIENNYMQILFKPSIAVQARELTQLQSILQNQISQLSGYVFTDGSPVYGGHISFDGTVTALQLQQQYSNTDINLSDFLVGGNNTLITNASGAVTIKAYVVAVDDTGTQPTLLVKYLTGTTFPDGSVIQVATGVQTQAQLIANGASSPASVVSINPGVFYSGGYFVTVPAQTIALSTTNNAPTFSIGLEINENIIDSVSDSTLLDPAQGSFNYQAPGADRYQYNLTLAARSPDSTDTSAFYQLLMLENGLVTSQVEYPVLGDLNTALAQRTYDTSGDFVVKPFTITTDVNQANANQYTIIVSPGKAYVKGYEYETVGSQRLFGDKALSTNTITDYSIALDYGNILTVNNVSGGNNSGIYNIAQYQPVDLHFVPSGQINTTNSNTYYATYMGQGRIRNIEFLGLGDYYAYVVSLNVTPNVVTASSGTANTFVINPGAASQVNAYANVTVTVNTAGTVDQRTIISYSNSTLTAIFDRPLSVNATNGSTMSLNYAIKDLESLVITPSFFGANVYRTQNANAAIDACMDIALAGKDITGNVVLSDTQFNKMIFALPQSYIAQNTITNASFYPKNNIWSQLFNSGNLTISSGSFLSANQSFPYGYTASYLSDAAANANFFVVVRNSMTSNIANGTVIQFNRGTVTNGNGVYQTDSTHATIVTSANASFVGDVIFTCYQQGAQVSTRRTKTLVGNSSNVTLLATDSPLNGNAVIGLNNVNSVYLDSTNGYAWFMSYYDQALTPGANQSLYTPDVFAITKVFDSGSPNHAPNTTNAIDITNRYYLNSGQTDNYYDHASLILKAGQNPPSGQTVVFMQYFNHDTVLGFFDADSYNANVYAQGLIPYYSSPTFGTFVLRDSIDFRPTRAIGSSASIQSYDFVGLKVPQPNDTLTLSYQFYLPRIDKLQLNKTGVFVLKEGVPSQYPVTPSDSDDAMTLYILNVPAYTANVKQIAIQYVENKRYTMKDIGSLDSRIQTLETYSAMSQLEQQTSSQKILYQDGVTAKDQYGILADDFQDFSIVDNQTTDLQIYLQPNTLSPFKLETPLGLKFTSNSGAYQKNDKTYSLPFTETPAIIQNTATTSVAIQPFLFGQFTGTCKLKPQTDYWFSQNLIPQIISPATANPALPPLPAQTTAPALQPSNQATLPPDSPIVASSKSDIIEFWGSDIAYNYYGDVTEVPVSFTSYGVLSIINQWFGVLTSKLQSSQQSNVASSIAGGSIQLAPGTSIINSTTVSPDTLQVI